MRYRFIATRHVGPGMGTTDLVSSTVAGEVRSTARRVGLALGLGFLALVVVPVTMAVAVALSGGDGLLPLGLLAFGVLGFLLVLVALPVALVGVAWVVVGTLAAEADSYVADHRLRVLRWAETAEETRWWGPFVKPTERLGFVDPLTDEERLEADLADARSAYVAGGLSEDAFERRLDRLFGIQTTVDGRGEFDRLRSSAPSAVPEDSREVTPGGRITR